MGIYEVRRPISSDRSLDRQAMTVSRHRTIEGACRSLERSRKAAADLGGYSQDFIWNCREECRGHTHRG
jgi:hypothetical protein